MQHKPPNTDVEEAMDPLTTWHSFAGVTGETGVRDMILRIYEDVLSSGQMCDDLRDNAQLVIAEVLNNIEEHSYQGEAGRKLRIKIGVREGELEVETQDFGRPMPNLEVPSKRDPNPNVPRYELPEGGFGWFLIHTLAPGPVYSRRGQTNILQFTITPS